MHTAAKGINGDLFGSVSEENVARIKRQNSRKISVIIGNPPYNANQANENDNNKNREYPDIDKRIKHTYIAAEHRAEDQALRHVCALLPLGQRPAERERRAGLVTNRSFIDNRTFDGFRKTVAQEFSDIYVVDSAETCMTTQN